MRSGARETWKGMWGGGHKGRGLNGDEYSPLLFTYLICINLRNMYNLVLAGWSHSTRLALFLSGQCQIHSWYYGKPKWTSTSEKSIPYLLGHPPHPNCRGVLLHAVIHSKWLLKVCNVNRSDKQVGGTAPLQNEAAPTGLWAGYED